VSIEKPEPDLRATEKFIRVVGKRRNPPAGEPPSPVARSALQTMAKYRTCAPKGVFIYESHEAANADRDRWIVDAIQAKHV
jgi:hypothetical protein